MFAVIATFIKAFEQLAYRPFLAVIVKAVIVTIIILSLCGLAAHYYLIAQIPVLSFTIFGYQIGFFDDLVRGLAGSLFVAAIIFAALPVAGMIVGLFLEEIAALVEKRYYPELPPARRKPLLEEIANAIIFTLTLILLNILALPIYVLSTVFAPFVFWSINGYLIGREYFEVVSHRRMPPVEAAVFRRRRQGTIWLAGFVGAIMLTIPFFNLVAAPLTVAAFTHLYHRLHK